MKMRSQHGSWVSVPTAIHCAYNQVIRSRKIYTRLDYLMIFATLPQRQPRQGLETVEVLHGVIEDVVTFLLRPHCGILRRTVLQFLDDRPII